jgi:hypothetical protein
MDAWKRPAPGATRRSAALFWENFDGRDEFLWYQDLPISRRKAFVQGLAPFAAHLNVMTKYHKISRKTNVYWYHGISE